MPFVGFTVLKIINNIRLVTKINRMNLASSEDLNQSRHQFLLFAWVINHIYCKEKMTRLGEERI